MRTLIFTFLLILSNLTHAHECTKFFSAGWSSDEGYACNVAKSDLNRMKLHRMEVCIGSVPYLDGKRYAHAEYKSISLLQYNNPYSRADGINNKFFDIFYSGLSFEGKQGERIYIHNEEGIVLKTFREGSTLTNEWDYKAEISLSFKTGRGSLTSYNRPPSLIFKKKWQKSIQVKFECKRVL